MFTFCDCWLLQSAPKCCTLVNGYQMSRHLFLKDRWTSRIKRMRQNSFFLQLGELGFVAVPLTHNKTMIWTATFLPPQTFCVSRLYCLAKTIWDRFLYFLLWPKTKNPSLFKLLPPRSLLNGWRRQLVPPSVKIFQGPNKTGYTFCHAKSLDAPFLSQPGEG